MAFLPEPRKWAEQQNYLYSHEDVYHDAIRKVQQEDYIKGQCQFDYTKMTTTGVRPIPKKSNCHYLCTEKRRVEGDVNTIEGSMRRSCYETRRNKDVKPPVTSY
jgi:hypothetical protein